MEGADVPRPCPVGCALVWPEFTNLCHDHISDDDAMALADYQEFTHVCRPERGFHRVMKLRQVCPDQFVVAIVDQCPDGLLLMRPEFLAVVINSRFAEHFLWPGLALEPNFDVFRPQYFETQCRIIRMPVAVSVVARGEWLNA